MAAVLALAGCVGEPPSMSVPPPQPGAPSPPVAQTSPRPLLRPPAVKPIGAGLLGAKAAEGYMDQEESDLRAHLRGSGIVVSRMGDNLVLNIPSDTLFGANSVALDARGAELLSTIALDARRFDSTQIVINGYTDTTGTDEQNLKVSQKRADAVQKALADNGVDPHRLAAKGFGAEILRIPTGPSVNEPRNRRIEMRITPRIKT
jgi:outer membrane protein OmpA-like peptidoglycan-associated protein